MTQAERDRLVALRKAKKKLITQKQAAEEIGVTERQVRRLVRKLRRKGDRAVIHELRGRASNRKLPAEMEQRAIAVLSDPVYRGLARRWRRSIYTNCTRLRCARRRCGDGWQKRVSGNPAGVA
jgi:DNA-binding Lrp family transcriptional regulator